MSVLTQEERSVVSTRLLSAGNVNLALLITIVFAENASHVATTHLALVVAQIGERILNSRENAKAVCAWLIAAFPTHSDNAALKAIVDRLEAQRINSAPNPTDEHWIGAEPMVNRGPLRALLQQITTGSNHGLVYVAGPRMSGRSHSWQLIRHVARQHNIKCSRVDFALETESRTIGHIYSELKRAYGINGINDPTYEGASPADVALKFAARLRIRLEQIVPTGSKPWIVIDYTEDVMDPAVPEFIRLFCTDRDRNLFDNCVIFVLGPLTHLETMRMLPTMVVEELGPVSEGEIFTTAHVVNTRGLTPLSPAALQAHATQIFSEQAALPEDERYPALRRALIELRIIVRAP